MRILFATTGYHMPEGGGGAHQSVRELCLMLQDRGMATAVLTGTAEDDAVVQERILDLKSRLAKDPDCAMGYPVFRRRDPVASIAEVAAKFEPSVVVVGYGATFEIAEACLAAKLPTIAYFRDVQLYWLYRDRNRALALDISHPLLRFLANSNFTARLYERTFGIEVAVVRSLVRYDEYRTEPRRQNVVFVNPILVKGLDIALKLAAARPDIPFDFVEGWTLGEEELQRLRGQFATLPNVSFRLRTPDMREVYGTAKLLLAPSRLQESSLRLAVEAQASGIPALASSRGGIPETVGEGGILLDPAADFRLWEKALGRLWDDEAEYARCAAAARAQSQRPELQPDALLDRFIEILSRHAAETRDWTASGNLTRHNPAPAFPPRGNARDVGLSIVIPTFERPDRLDRLLASLRAPLTESPNRQAIVVNDGSHDDRYAAVAERHKDYVEYLALPRNLGPAAARNAGVARARHDYIVFVDDDCVVTPYWLDWLGAILAENPELEVVAGTTRPLPAPNITLLAGLRADCGFYPQPVVVDDRLVNMVTACLAIRRGRFMQMHGLDETMRTSEDRNLTYRLGRDHAVFYLDESWYVHHDMSGSLLQHLRRYFNYGRGLARQLAIEQQPIDRVFWPVDDRSWRYWRRQLSEISAFVRSCPAHRAKPFVGRMTMHAFAVLTRFTMNSGVIRGGPRGRASASTLSAEP